MRRYYRHAVALALVGWYLMMPPFKEEPPVADFKAPISQWSMTSPSYDSAKECEAAKRQGNIEWRGFREYIRASGKCVARDDPRLKSN